MENMCESVVEDSRALIANKSSHHKAQPRKGRNFNRQHNTICFYCKEKGHWKTECPVYRRKLSGGKQNSAKGEAYVSICSAATASSASEGEWFLDSGASDHMTNRRDWFINYKELDSPIAVRMGNGVCIYAVGKGDINILSFDNFTWLEKHLENVLYVPDIHLNLFSQSTVLDKNLELVSDKQKCELMKDGVVVAVGIRYKRLFKMLFKVLPPNVKMPSESSGYSAVKQSTSLQLWHERMGHQNITQVKRFLTSINKPFVELQSFACDDCIIGKHHRSPFPRSTSRATQPAALVHTDVCGPMQEQSIGGSRYFVLFKDDYSQYRTVYFVKHKSEVSQLIETYISSVKASIRKDLQVLRSDNGLEFISKTVEDILQRHSVRHERSVPYSPQQNGRAERDMRTIVESARTMLHAKELSLRFWAEAVACAVYVLNRSGPTFVADKSPYELWFGKTPKIDHLRVFGSEVYTHVPKQQRQKWDKKAKPGIFIGYCDGTKGFRVWNTATRKVEVSRDIVFKEISQSAASIDVNVDADAEERVEAAIKHEISFDKLFVDDVTTADVKQSQSPPGPAAQVKPDPLPPSQAVSDPKQETPIRNRLRSGKQSNFDCNFSEGYAFVAECDEPQSYRAAIESSDSDKWKAAMADEMQSLRQNKVWTLVSKPNYRAIVDNRWVFRVKRNVDDNVERYKARLVARGFSQQHGIDYQETFSPVVKFTSIRSILGIAAAEKLNLKQFDVKTAFLYGDLSEDIYMCQPEGFSDGTDNVCKLQKSLYGLKQSARCWNQKFTSFLKKFKLTAVDADPCVFVNHRDNKKVILAIYIDDGLIAAKDDNDISTLLEHLQREFEIKVSDASVFLGLEIRQHTDYSVHINQSTYIAKILAKFNMSDAVPVSTPAETTTPVGVQDGQTVVTYPFREAVGSLMYLAVATRPDIAFAISSVSRHLENPSPADVTAVRRVMKYIKGTANLGIFFDSQCEINLNAFSDADYAGDHETRRSTSGFVFMLGSGAIAWCSQRQKCVALSTTESEYIAASETVKELVWLKRLLSELLAQDQLSTTLYMDNQSAIRLVKNPEFHKRTKHIDVRFHYIREQFEKHSFVLEFVSSKDQLGDIFTKALPKDTFNFLRNKIGIVSLK